VTDLAIGFVFGVGVMTLIVLVALAWESSVDREGIEK